jgi:nitrilase
LGVVAAIQSTSVYVDGLATARKAAQSIAEAAQNGAWLAVFPETYIPGNPDFIDRAVPGSAVFEAFERRFLESAVTVPGPEIDVIAEACRKHQMTVAIGVTERPARSGTLYNTLLYVGPDGSILGRHRKVMPTYSERMIWGMGDGTTLRTIETPHGIVGGLICWENFMPMPRMVLYAQGEQLHLAPTLAPGGERWIAAMRHIANEGRMWVVSVGNIMRETDLPRDLAKLGLYKPDEVINPGGSMIVNPKGEIVAGPVYAQETILYADADPAESLLAKRDFDVVGHYGRADLFGLTVRNVQIPLQIDGQVLPAFDDHVWHVGASERAHELKVSADPAADSPQP